MTRGRVVVVTEPPIAALAQVLWLGNLLGLGPLLLLVRG